MDGNKKKDIERRREVDNLVCSILVWMLLIANKRV